LVQGNTYHSNNMQHMAQELAIQSIRSYSWG